MNKINKVVIKNFWGDKTVNFDLDNDINFLIGVNGSGKTTIINLIAATLCADFKTLDLTQFDAIELTLSQDVKSRYSNNKVIIKVEKVEKEHSPYPSIVYSIKTLNPEESHIYYLDDIEDESLYRYRNDYIIRENLLKSRKNNTNDLNAKLESLVNVSWLTIHRLSSRKRKGSKNFESTIDEKIEDLQIELVKYFSQLNRLYSIETEKFQKYIFESLLETSNTYDLINTSNLDVMKEKDSLISIFKYFKLNEKTSNKKIQSFFEEYQKSYQKLKKISKDNLLTLKDFEYLVGTIKIHNVIEEWNVINEKQKQINKTREMFLQVVNYLLQRKQICINERNELYVKTQSGKFFSLYDLSSGEKQLLIIFAQALLQDEKTHIYIADEPELSLHIEWQETLVQNLKNLNPNSQIIFATHSPDIVAEFDNKVIKVEKFIK